MRYLVLCVTLNILFFINTVYSLKIESAKYDNPESQSVNFNIKQTFHLSCNVSEDKNSSGEVKWRKNNAPLKSSDRFKLSNKGNTYTLTISESRETDAGNYSCTVEDNGKITSERLIKALSNLKIKVPSNINVVEGEKLKIHCQVKGLPLPELTWEYKNDTYNHSYTESNERVILELDPERDIDNSYLIIEKIDMYDRGVFTCIATSPVTGLELDRSTCMVRVKDKYAALWPFLGICAEVITLCAIIFIYEKKRNKTELEESDTDQSPDQKNTPDHGKDSNLRHRQ